MSASGWRPSRPVAVLLVAATVAGCAIGGAPWDRPVEGAQSVTEWIEDIPLEVGRSGAGLPSSGEVLAGIRDMEMGRFGVAAGDVIVGFLGDEEDATGVGYARTTLPARAHPLVAMDLRFDMRRDAEGWRIETAERRFHCAAETATELCE